MKIENVRPCTGPASAKGFRNIGRFSLRITDDVLLYDLCLVKSPDGRLLLYPPQTAYGAPSMALAPKVRTAIIREAMTIFEDQINDGHRVAA
ncbi:hypothetical protein [Mesorhizobium sp.]|uniref:hypothetical protein n=1 Tax=Mesorhizobium sp. TaxID=1871066 RepID=UPI000FEA4CC4|nr:hypothetical protein [Mesorhizobium sp.]RWF62549.1 MAG: hypothetical protein EOS47_22995 [Mesorhizobium sp.]TIT43835.1 MAG: hypothetical protein E5W76_04985 [Mesorhizobium sp.]